MRGKIQLADAAERCQKCILCILSKLAEEQFLKLPEHIFIISADLELGTGRPKMTE